MNTRALERQARRLSDKLQPRPRLIDCAGEKKELLATLERQIEQDGGDLSAPVEWTLDQLEIGQKLDEWLEQSCREIEQRYNVRFVS